jgi:hypothetical protein
MRKATEQIKMNRNTLDTRISMAGLLKIQERNVKSRRTIIKTKN